MLLFILFLLLLILFMVRMTSIEPKQHAAQDQPILANQLRPITLIHHKTLFDVMKSQRGNDMVMKKQTVLNLFQVQKHHSLSKNQKNVFIVNLDNLSIQNGYQILEPAYIRTYIEAKNRGAERLWLTLPSYPLPMVIHTINMVHQAYGQGLQVFLIDPDDYCTYHHQHIVLSLEGLEMFSHTCPQKFTLMTQCAPSAFIP